MSANPAEKIRIGCPLCGKQLMVPTSALGKMGKCPGCQNMFPLQASSAAPARPATTAPPVVRKPPVAAAPRPAALPLGNPTADPFGDLSEFNSGEQPTAPMAQAPFGAPQSPASPQFGQQPYSGGSGLQQPNPSQWSNPYAPTATKPQKKRAKKPSASDDATPLGQIGGGILMMIGAIVWFVVGMMNGIIFFYPPVLLILGLVSLVAGVVGLGKR